MATATTVSGTAQDVRRSQLCVGVSVYKSTLPLIQSDGFLSAIQEQRSIKLCIFPILSKSPDKEAV